MDLRFFPELLSRVHTKIFAYRSLRFATRHLKINNNLDGRNSAYVLRLIKYKKNWYIFRKSINTDTLGQSIIYFAKLSPTNLVSVIFKYTFQRHETLWVWLLSKWLLLWNLITFDVNPETLQFKLHYPNISALSPGSSASKSNNHYLVLLWVGL